MPLHPGSTMAITAYMMEKPSLLHIFGSMKK